MGPLIELDFFCGVPSPRALCLTGVMFFVRFALVRDGALPVLLALGGNLGNDLDKAVTVLCDLLNGRLGDNQVLGIVTRVDRASWAIRPQARGGVLLASR
jgi:hypothetical protein